MHDKLGRIYEGKKRVATRAAVLLLLDHQLVQFHLAVGTQLR
jgi:hypothetical protein